MDKMLYVMNSGAKAAMQRQEVLANNLANVSTVGFRAELHAIRSVPVNGSAANTRSIASKPSPCPTSPTTSTPRASPSS